MLALFGLDGWEIILILALVFLLFGSKRIPLLWRGLGNGVRAFKDATRDVIDSEAFDAGRSVGGIYGKPAAQALTPDNHVSELYNPAAFEKEKNSPHIGKALLFRFTSILRSTISFWRKILRRLLGV